MAFVDRKLELKPLDAAADEVWALIDWLFAHRKYAQCQLPKPGDAGGGSGGGRNRSSGTIEGGNGMADARGPNALHDEAAGTVADDLLEIIMALQGVEDFNRPGFRQQPDDVKWLIVTNFFSTVEEDALSRSVPEAGDGGGAGGAAEAEEGGATTSNNNNNNAKAAASPKRYGVAFHSAPALLCSFCHGKAYAMSRVAGAGENLILCLACMKTAHSSGSSNRTYDDDLAGLSNGDGGGTLMLIAGDGDGGGGGGGGGSLETAASAAALRNLQRDHPAFKRLVFDVHSAPAAERRRSAAPSRVPTGYWCALCLCFESPHGVCYCQTCKAMTCTRTTCAVPTTTESTSLRKFECRSCWYDRWYAAIKDRAGDVMLGSRVFAGESHRHGGLCFPRRAIVSRRRVRQRGVHASPAYPPNLPATARGETTQLAACAFAFLDVRVVPGALRCVVLRPCGCVCVPVCLPACLSVHARARTCAGLAGQLPDWFHVVFYKTSATDRLPAKPVESWRAVYHSTTFDLIQVSARHVTSRHARMMNGVRARCARVLVGLHACVPLGCSEGRTLLLLVVSIDWSHTMEFGPAIVDVWPADLVQSVCFVRCTDCCARCEGWCAAWLLTHPRVTLCCLPCAFHVHL